MVAISLIVTVTTVVFFLVWRSCSGSYSTYKIKHVNAHTRTHTCTNMHTHTNRGVGAGGAGGGNAPPPPHFYCTGGRAPQLFINACIFTHAINPIACALDLFPTAHGQICPLTLFIAATPLTNIPILSPLFGSVQGSN